MLRPLASKYESDAGPCFPLLNALLERNIIIEFRDVYKGKVGDFRLDRKELLLALGYVTYKRVEKTDRKAEMNHS